MWTLPAWMPAAVVLMGKSDSVSPSAQNLVHFLAYLTCEGPLGPRGLTRLYRASFS